MKNILKLKWPVMVATASLMIAATSIQAQNLTNPCPNRVISWNVDNGVGTVTPTDIAGLAPAVNWMNTTPGMPNYDAFGLTDNAGNATTVDLRAHANNISGIPWPTATDPGLDANGTANKRILNVYLNNGLAGWNPTDTNVYVSLTNIPYARYDVVVYFDADASGRKATIDNGLGETYRFSTVGTAFRTGPNCTFLPTTETNSSIYPAADFAFFHGMTSPNAVFTETPKSGDGQWLGICAFQVIESSNVYVLYGPAPAAQTIPVGQPASFKVMAGGLNPSYQWRHAGTNILDATNAAYSIAATAAGQDGNYDVVVANSFSSVTGVVATLTFYAPKNVEWRGNGSTWNTSSAFWTLSGGGAGTYTETDNVRFGPAGSAQPTVTLSGTHTPNSIVISNASYTFVSGGLAGTGSLHLRNNATFILDTIDGRTGPTLIDSGSTFQLDNGDTAGSMGAGPLTNNGNFVFNAAGDEAYGYPIYGSGNITNLGPSGRITLGGAVNAAYLVQAGSSELLLQGENNISSGMVISGGNVQVVAANALGGAPVTILTGGELRLYWGYEYTAASLTLAGGTLHGGIGGSQILHGPASLTADSTINIDGGNSLTLDNSTGISGGGFNIGLTGGTLILGGTNNTWGTLDNSGTLQIGNGGVASLGAGTIANNGTLTFNASNEMLVTNVIAGGGTLNQFGSGIVTLAADLAAAGFSGAINVTNGTLRVNGTSGPGTVLVDGGALGGTGTIGGPVTVTALGTLAPGASVGTLTINSDLSLGGNMLVEVNKSLSPSNDLVAVSGALANTGAGTVTVNNLGPALAVGDKFKLFSQLVSGGETLTVTGSGANWTNRLAEDGSIQVLSVAPVSHPVITSVVLAGGNSILFSGTNGPAGGPYSVRSSTNVTLPLESWAVESSGNFGPNGSFSVTNPVSPGVRQKFYLLRQ